MGYHVVGTDIAELLMTAVEEEKKAIVVEEIRDDVEGREDEEIEDTPAAPIEPTPPPVVEPKDEEKLVEQFCEHLLYGHRKDALDFAMDNGLWGHALFFASKMDDRLNGNVLARFANGIAMNSPLQTLYHIICGKQPASVTSCADESFGDWKPHLAMLLSNSGKNPEVEHRAMLTLGDTLANRNHLYAAQFCYLMAQDEFRIGSRIGHLLGYSPDAKNVLEATQMTEVYEFALKLQEGHPPPLGLSFLESKLEYAKQLVNLGFIQEALAYCEEITKTLDITAKKLESRELTLCANTLQIAERIALADESGEASKVESWVGNLKRIVANPTAFDENSRKLTTQSSQEQSSEVPYTSLPQQQQVVSNETYDPTLYNQQQLLPPDMSSVSQNQYDTVGVPGVAINNSSNVPPENTMIGGGSANVQENNWSNPTQMNGGFHITQPMYDVTQQLSQMTLNTNTADSTSPYSNNPDGNYPSYDGGYASTGGYGE
ncbi:Protein transport protein Sec16A [Orchesella cincta]|uniref:Protein transport protein Sec16A n=1 Tax=Orchesella cincta TaxID=48709 RepID=A0A1D2NEE6_ORCCI|nr:Protein transport protein Sec16A [Orchesella cincta]